MTSTPISPIQNVKHQHRVQIKYDIYKQFVSLHKEIPDSVSELG